MYDGDRWVYEKKNDRSLFLERLVLGNLVIVGDFLLFALLRISNNLSSFPIMLTMLSTLRAFVSNVFKYALTSLTLSLSRRGADRGTKNVRPGQFLFL